MFNESFYLNRLLHNVFEEHTGLRSYYFIGWGKEFNNNKRYLILSLKKNLLIKGLPLILCVIYVFSGVLLKIDE